MVSPKKPSKKVVKIEQFRNSIRLRWTYEGKRYPLTVGDLDSSLKASQLASQIETDLKTGRFDTTLEKYKGQLPRTKRGPQCISIADYYEKWLKATGQNSPTHHVKFTLVMLKSWGDVTYDDLPERLYSMGYSAYTFNSRMNILKDFIKWLIKKKLVTDNPLDDIKSQKSKGKRKQRTPFTDEEILPILEAFRTDQFSKGPYPHSRYYPFLKFIFLTGVRNAEAIGLQVGRVDFAKGVITIDQAFARQGNASNSKSRILKGTKTENVRYLPLSPHLREVLQPLCTNRNPSDFVFTSHRGNPIDDRMFQKRAFKPVLSKLGIPERDLYAIRHTFGTVAIEQGMTPLDAGYLMGHSNPKTILENYAHLRRLPGKLPDIIKQPK